MTGTCTASAIDRTDWFAPRRKECIMATEAKTVIVTGASQGIGAGIVSAFRDRGYGVVANSRSISTSRAFRRR